jgi:hypothetical protein
VFHVCLNKMIYSWLENVTLCISSWWHGQVNKDCLYNDNILNAPVKNYLF